MMCTITKCLNDSYFDPVFLQKSRVLANFKNFPALIYSTPIKIVCGPHKAKTKVWSKLSHNDFFKINKYGISINNFRFAWGTWKRVMAPEIVVTFLFSIFWFKGRNSNNSRHFNVVVLSVLIVSSPINFHLYWSVHIGHLFIDGAFISRQHEN